MHLLTLTNTEDFNEADILSGTIKAAPEGGFTLDTMRDAIRLSDQLEALVEAMGEVTVELEPKDYAYLQRRMQTAKWRVADPRLIDLTERCLSVPSVQPKAEVG